MDKKKCSGDLPKATRIVDVVLENIHDVTLTLDCHLEFIPGQFVMIWIPSQGEKPFSIAGQSSSGQLLITVRKRGKFSTQLSNFTKGDMVGIRGPYGNGFSSANNPIIIAGGVGIAAVAPLIEKYNLSPVLYGENSLNFRMYKRRFTNVEFFTVDGSAGNTGYPTDCLAEIISCGNHDLVFSCGPELMLLNVASICESHSIACQLSLERYMKCAKGLCGQCACDKHLVCADGPVFYGSTLLSENRDFGKTKMNRSSHKEPVGGEG